MVARASVPILLLTGFLGSGKTSLLARWLKAPEFAGAMAIVNELGEVGIDDRLVESSSDAPLLLDNGCACCAAGEDLTATLERLFWDRLHRKIPKFSWVLIETTGIADPGPILERLATHALVAERYHVEGVVAAFDARLGAAQLARHPECARQLKAARVVVITKTDIAGEVELAAARAAIAGVREDARVLTSSRADLSAAAMIAALAQSAPRPAADNGLRAEHTARVSTAFAAVPGVVTAAALTSAFGAVMDTYEAGLLRLKGIVRLAPDGALNMAQALPGVGVEISLLPARPGAPAPCGFTIIAQDVAAQTIADAVVARLAASRPLAYRNTG